MKKFSWAYVSLLLIGLPILLAAQQDRGVCGTHGYATMDRLIQNQEAIKRGFVQNRGAVTYVPIKYHLVARTNKTGRVKESDVMEMHCHLNDLYSDQDLQFYIKDGTFNYIDNDAVYDNHSFTQGTIMAINKDSRAMNIYIVKDATPQGGGQSPGTTLGYYSPGRDWIVMRIDQVNDISQTLPHEAGHFFSLPHTFLGWESDPFDSGDAGWPKAPALAPDGVTQTEKMDGSNCATAADRFCDTRPDYNFGLINGQSCTYTGNAQDPNGIAVDPDETNIMSYFTDRCVDNFTGEQKAAIGADLASNARAFLRQGWTPPATTITPSLTPIYPKNGETVPFESTMQIDWEDVDGATGYIFQIATNQFFSDVRTFYTSSSNVEVDALQNRKKYYWRISSYNAYYTCSASILSAVQTFTPDSNVSSTQEIPFIAHFGAYPNPAPSGSSLRLELLSEKSFTGDVRIYNLTGQLWHRQIQSFVAGENTIPVSTSNFSPGTYLAFVQSEEGILKTKFVISQ